MVIINKSEEYNTLFINEGYMKENEEWGRNVILRFPKTEFTEEAATEIAERATMVESIGNNKITTYYVTGIVDKKVDDYFTDVWLKNPEVKVEDNLANKVFEIEAVVNTLVGGAE